MILDPFSRLLTGVARSLGKGLAQVGQVKAQKQAVEQQARLQKQGQQEQTRLQSIEAIRRDLLGRALELQKSAGFGMLPEAERQVFTDAVRNLIGSPTLDANAIAAASELFTNVSRAGAMAETINTLARQGKIPEIGAMVHGMPPEAAEQYLVGIGLAPGLAATARTSWIEVQAENRVRRSYGEEQVTALRLQNNITREITPDVIAEAALKVQREDANLQITREQAKTIAERLKSQQELLNQQIAEGRLRIDALPQQIDLSIRKLAQELQIDKANLRQIVEQTQNIITQRGLVQAQTGQVQAQTELTQEQTRSVAIQNAVADEVRQYALSKEMNESINRATNNIILANMTDPKQIAEWLIRSTPGLSQEIADSMAQGIATRVGLANRLAEANATEADIKAANRLMELSTMASVTPEQLSGAIDRALPGPEREGLRNILKNTLPITRILGWAKVRQDIIDAFIKQPPPPTREAESQALRGLYDGIIQGNVFGKQTATMANGIVAAIRMGWQITRNSRNLADQKLAADITQSLANASYQRALAEQASQQTDIARGQLALGWAKHHENARQADMNYEIGWAKIFSDNAARAQAAAANAATPRDQAKLLQTLASALKSLDAIHQEQVLREVQKKRGHCVAISGTVTSVVRSPECQEVFENVYKLPAIKETAVDLKALNALITDLMGQAIGAEGVRQGLPVPGQGGGTGGTGGGAGTGGAGESSGGGGRSGAGQGTSPPPVQPQGTPRGQQQGGEIVNVRQGSIYPPSHEFQMFAKTGSTAQFGYSQRFPVVAQLIAGQTVNPNFANIPSGNAAVGFTAVLIGTEHVPGVSDDNPLQYVHPSHRADLEACRRQTKSVRDLALCQGAKQMAKATFKPAWDGTGQAVKIQPWMTLSAAAHAHTLPQTGLAQPIRADFARANPAPTSFARVFRNSDKPITGDWVALNLYNHFLAFGDYYDDEILSSMVSGVRANSDIAARQLAAVSYVMAFLPQKKEPYGIADIMKTIMRLEKLPDPPITGRPNGDMVEWLTQLAQAGRLENIGRQISAGARRTARPQRG